MYVETDEEQTEHVRLEKVGLQAASLLGWQVDQQLACWGGRHRWAP
jgi:hypothetical protein